MDQTSPAPSHEAPRSPAGRRRLVREPDDRRIAGVCSGLADAVGVDPSLVRIVAVVLTFVTPAALVAYVVLSVVLPERRPDPPRHRADCPYWGRAPHPVVVVGAVVVVASMIDGAWWLEPFPAAVALVGVGVWLLVRDRDDRDLWATPVPAPAPPSAPSMFDAGPAGGSAPVGGGPDDATPFGTAPGFDGPVDARPAGTTPVDAVAGDGGPDDTLPDGTVPDGTSLNGTTLRHPMAGSPWYDASQEAGDGGSDRAPGGGPTARYGSRPWWEAGAEPEVEPAPVAAWVAPAPARRSRLGRATLALLLLTGGALWLAASLGLFTVSITDGLALGLVGVGVALVVAAWVGHAYALIPVGVLLTAALVVGELIDIPLDAGVGDRTVVVTTVDQMATSHQLVAGDLTLDLADAPLDPDGGTPTVEAELGAGELEVIVPRDATVELHATSRAGDLQTPDDSANVADEIGLDETITLDGEAGGGLVELDLEVGVGDVIVTRSPAGSDGGSPTVDPTTPTTTRGR